ncbi:zinc finger domain-containing protein [Candidatus Moduliflexus flocculans]|uniref:Zinc finger domain-containing protein n=1 Tax=Candidatus Moduliflexus flocculans TaxID=1499966 RepID=A0A081BR50_9BACT|nr:zinc finger domain-containing protein [Candidatus Moduliflexus flocculans]
MKTSEERKMPQIKCSLDGPYVLNDFIEREVAYLQNEQGEKYCRTVGVSLCRCGGSKNKPFCDGTHKQIGFSDKNSADSTLDKRQNFEGKEITIHFNRALCSSSERCVHGLPSVFVAGGKPWIRPDGDTVAKIIATIKQCPSGALSYSIDGVEYRDQVREPMITVAKNGPYEVTGSIELANPPTLCECASTEHYTLCRCGASKNKPFCDGTHWEINFTSE